MENATQFLLMAGGILIALIIVGTGIFLVVNYSKVNESYEQKQEMVALEKFNTNFTIFAARNNITAQEIATIANFAYNYNKENTNKIQVKVLNKNYADDNNVNHNKDIVEFVKLNSLKADGQTMQYFSCNENKIKYDENGRIKLITFEKN